MARLNEAEQVEVRRATEVLAWVNDYAYKENPFKENSEDMLLMAMANVTREASKRLERVARAYRLLMEVG